MKASILLLLISLLAGCSTSQNSQILQEPTKEITKHSFLYISSENLKNYMCKINTLASRCVGIKSLDNCNSNINKVYPICSDRISNVMPEIISGKEEMKRFGILLSQCSLLELAKERKVPLKTLETCMTQK